MPQYVLFYHHSCHTISKLFQFLPKRPDISLTTAPHFPSAPCTLTKSIISISYTLDGRTVLQRVLVPADSEKEA